AGNALEVMEAVSFLRGEGDNARLESVVLGLSAELLVLGGLFPDRDAARKKLKLALGSGQAAEIFNRMVAALGGPPDLIERATEYLPVAEFRREVKAPAAGWLSRIDTRELGMAVIELGGGRRRAEDKIDHSVGLSGLAGLGRKVAEGDVLAVVHAREESAARQAERRVQAAITISEQESSAQPVIYEVVEAG
ncbi:MAG: thymidine phosphorylase, partial [Verrucomicrobiales bacterium]